VIGLFTRSPVVRAGRVPAAAPRRFLADEQQLFTARHRPITFRTVTRQAGELDVRVQVVATL